MLFYDFTQILLVSLNLFGPWTEPARTSFDSSGSRFSLTPLARLVFGSQSLLGRSKNWTEPNFSNPSCWRLLSWMRHLDLTRGYNRYISIYEVHDFFLVRNLKHFAKKSSKIEILYHFDQFGSHASRMPVFCRKLVTGHGAECRIDPLCDMTKMP